MTSETPQLQPIVPGYRLRILSDVQLAQFKSAGLDTSREELALDVIKAVGPRGHFLSQRHTRTNIRKRRFSDITDQPGTDGRSRDPIQVAREKTDWILENHHPEPLTDEQQAEFRRILAAADKEAGSGQRSSL